MQALAKTQQKEPDLFLVDISMPEHNGWFLVNELRQKGLKTPVVMLSAEAAEGMAPPEAKGKYNGYLIKPFRQEQLFSQISRLLPVTFILKSTRSGAAQNAAGNLSAGSAQKEDLRTEKHSISEGECRKLFSLLLTYCDIGFVKGIEDCVEKLRASECFTESFACMLERLASEYRFDELKKAVSVKE